MKTIKFCSGAFSSALFALGALASPANAQAPTDSVLQLPDLKVTGTADLPKPESWRYTKIEGFEILSNASDRATKSLVADFAQFTQALQLMWPATAKPLAASTIILCGKGGKFDQFLPPGTFKDDALVPSVFLRNREQIAIVADVETSRVAVDGSMAETTSVGTVEFEVDHYRQLYREYVHYLLSQSQVRPPAWLEEGLAQIIMDVELTDRHLIYGKVDSYKGEVTGVSPLEPGEDADAAVANAVVGERPFNVVLQYRRLMPLGEFFAMDHDSEAARSPLGNNLWAKQAYAFVHYCLFGAKLRHKEALVAFVDRLTREPLSESLFKECFKTDYKGMVGELNGYFRHTRHQYQQYTLQASDRVKPADVELTDAAAGQIGLIKGDALLLAGHPEAAYTEYRNAYRRGSREPALFAGLAATVPDPAMAAKFTDEAVKAASNRPSAYVRQARLRLAAFQTDPGSDGRLTQQQLAAVLSPLFQARKLPPALPELYETIAEAWARSSVAPTPAHLAVLDEGVRQFPRHSDLLYRAAKLYQQAGVASTAAAITQLGLRFTTEPAAKSQFEELLAALPPAGQ